MYYSADSTLQCLFLLFILVHNKLLYTFNYEVTRGLNYLSLVSLLYLQLNTLNFYSNAGSSRLLVLTLQHIQIFILSLSPRFSVLSLLSASSQEFLQSRANVLLCSGTSPTLTRRLRCARAWLELSFSTEIFHSTWRFSKFLYGHYYCVRGPWRPAFWSSFPFNVTSRSRLGQSGLVESQFVWLKLPCWW